MQTMALIKLKGAGDYPSWREAAYRYLLERHPATRSLIFIDTVPADHEELQRREEDRRLHLANVARFIPELPELPQRRGEGHMFGARDGAADVDMEQWNQLAKAAEAATKIRDKARDMATSASQILLGALDPNILDAVEATEDYTINLRRGDLGRLWEAIANAVKPTGAARSTHKAAAFTNFTNIKMGATETYDQYFQRFRGGRMASIEAGNPDLPEGMLAGIFINGLNADYNVLRQLLNSEEDPPETLMEAQRTARRWTPNKTAMVNFTTETPSQAANDAQVNFTNAASTAPKPAAATDVKLHDDDPTGRRTNDIGCWHYEGWRWKQLSAAKKEAVKLHNKEMRAKVGR